LAAGGGGRRYAPPQSAHVTPSARLGKVDTGFPKRTCANPRI
jgi:hypothetical protein